MTLVLLARHVEPEGGLGDQITTPGDQSGPPQVFLHASVVEVTYQVLVLEAAVGGQGAAGRRQTWTLASRRIAFK